MLASAMSHGWYDAFLKKKEKIFINPTGIFASVGSFSQNSRYKHNLTVSD